MTPTAKIVRLDEQREIISLFALIDGRQYNIEKDHKFFDSLVAAFKAESWEEFVKLANISETVNNYVKGVIEVLDGEVFYKGEAGSNSLPEIVVDRILGFINQGLDAQPLVNFLNKLMKNPSRKAIEALYSFMEQKHMPITIEGNIIAYKGVRTDFKDCFSGTYDNSPGADNQIPRNECDDNSSVQCSKGFHVGTYDYAKSFGPVLVIVEINPKDVISVPDANTSWKIRVCKYKVLEVLGDREALNDVYYEN